MTTLRRHRDVDTATQILDVAERLAQSRGFNGFSYADVASELHLTKAALHYHFAGKAELGEALIARYSARFAAALVALDTRASSAPSPVGRLCQPVPRCGARQTDVPVRHARRRVPDPPPADAGGGHPVFRCERGLVARRRRPGSAGGHAAHRRIPDRDRTGHRWRSRGSNARCAVIWRHCPLRGRYGPSARRTGRQRRGLRSSYIAGVVVANLKFSLPAPAAAHCWQSVQENAATASLYAWAETALRWSSPGRTTSCAFGTVSLSRFAAGSESS